jgi:hypothetical protein
MTTLPRLLTLAGALVLGALAASATAANNWPAMGPEFAAPQPVLSGPAAEPTFASGTLPWAPPPLPPLPGAFLWQDYSQLGPAQRYYRSQYHRGCAGRGCSHNSRPVLTAISDVLEGFMGLLTYPSRKAAAKRMCASGQCGAGSYEMNPALRDWGAYPPADPMPYVPPQPIPESSVPVQPRVDVPPSPPPSAPPVVTTDQGLPPLRSNPDGGLRSDGQVQPVEPQRLYPGRAPVVELAPALPIPPEASPLPPTNTIPKSDDRPPKNVIPGRQ